MFRPDAKDNIRTVLKYAVSTAIATIVITFLIVLPLRDVLAPDAEKRTEGIVKQINDRVSKLESRLKKQVVRGNSWTNQHRNHSCAQHALTFLASLDPGEVDAFSKQLIREAFSKCPKDLKYRLVRFSGRHPANRGQSPQP